MIGALNKLPVAVSGMIFFNDPVTLRSVSAVSLGFAAGLLYTHAKQLSNEEKKRAQAGELAFYFSLVPSRAGGGRCRASSLRPAWGWTSNADLHPTPPRHSPHTAYLPSERAEEEVASVPLLNRDADLEAGGGAGDVSSGRSSPSGRDRKE